MSFFCFIVVYMNDKQKENEHIFILLYKYKKKQESVDVPMSPFIGNLKTGWQREEQE